MVDSNTSPSAPSTTWMSTAGGICSIIVGVLDLIGCLVTGFITCAGAAWSYRSYSSFAPGVVPAIFGFITFYLLIIGLLGIIGGIFAVQRKHWGLSLAGAIAAFFGGGNIFGILAIVFIALGKKDFQN